MKQDTVFKRAYNGLLDQLSEWERGTRLPSEKDLSSLLGVSRTTIRKTLMRSTKEGFVKGDDKKRKVGRRVRPTAYFPTAETVPTSEQVETRLMEWMLRGDIKPGTLINELELARRFKIGITGVREFLNRFRRFGLIEKRPNVGWLFKGFTEEFAAELFEISELFELRSARAFVALPPEATAWETLNVLREEHLTLLAEINTRFNDFPDLDSRFHRFISAAKPNRFIEDFHDVISLIFCSHYQWDKRDERQRNEAAIGEHLSYIDALLKRNQKAAEAACRHHLMSAKRALSRVFRVDRPLWDG